MPKTILINKKIHELAIKCTNVYSLIDIIINGILIMSLVSILRRHLYPKKITIHQNEGNKSVYNKCSKYIYIIRLIMKLYFIISFIHFIVYEGIIMYICNHVVLVNI